MLTIKEFGTNVGVDGHSKARGFVLMGPAHPGHTRKPATCKCLTGTSMAQRREVLKEKKEGKVRESLRV